MSANINYKKLYYDSDTIKDRFKPSLSNYFDVFINKDFDNINTDAENDINFLAYEAVLPGTSYETGQVFGDRQGITEQYPIKRVYPPVDVSFYVDGDYKVLRFFESWMGAISPNKGKDGSTDSYVKFNYPKNQSGGGYETDVIITKFERDFRDKGQRLVKGGVYRMPSSNCIYTLKNAYPINIISVPVSYDQNSVLRTTVTFNYDVYSFARSDGRIINEPDQAATGSIGPGGDAGTLSELNEQVRLINENIPTTGLNPNPRDVG